MKGRTHRLCFQEKIEKGNFLLIHLSIPQTSVESLYLGTVTLEPSVEPSAPKESTECYRNTIPKLVWDSTEKECLTQASLKEKQSNIRKRPILYNTCRNLTVDINRK